ncbi:MAG: hypothetical protein Q9O62_10300 [Ardenticatenia bacterium]|nr:hypothetical protein [Ardenticatenia bacterium]
MTPSASWPTPSGNGGSRPTTLGTSSTPTSSPRAHDRVRQIIADVRQAWQATEYHIASDTPDQVLQAWTTLISLWQWSPRLAALCDDLDISTELPRPDVLAQRAHAYLERLPQRVFSSSDQQHLSQLLGELDPGPPTVAGFPDAAQLPCPPRPRPPPCWTPLTMALAPCAAC